MADQQGVDAHSVPDATTAAQLSQDGYTFIAQYIDQNDSNETFGSAGFEQSADGPAGGHLTAAEAQAETAAGLQIVSIFETNGEAVSPYSFPLGSSNSTPNEIMPYLDGTTTYQAQTVSQGFADGKEAVLSAQAVGQPTGSAIYFALDFDPGVGSFYPGLQQAVETYLTDVSQALAGSGYSLGVYGAAQTLEWATTNDPSNSYTSNVSYTWLSGSSGWAGYGSPGTEGSEISGPGGNTPTHGWTMLQAIPGDAADTNPNEQSNVAPGTSLGVDYDGTDSSGFGQWSAPCYVTGARILTNCGEAPVESLRAGDLLVTASGALRPVRWMGHRRVDISRHPDPASVRPVRVSAHAFGDGLPHRDLWLSPGHNIAWGGSLMPISALINGRSIQQVERAEVEYWHVELDAHDILVAEGLPAESYLDCGNRTHFANGGAFVDLHPDFQPKLWNETCLPLALAGPAVEAAKRRLLDRLSLQDQGVTSEADAHVYVDGQRIEPIRLSGTRLAFALPEGKSRITLQSKTFVPAHLLPESGDTRELGLCVARLEVDGVDVVLDDHETCSSGWREAEFSGGHFSHRWTTGATPLPAGARIVIIDIAGDGHYRRVPENNAAARYG